MIDYPTIRPALISLIEDLVPVGLSLGITSNVVWEDQGQLYGKSQYRLKIGSPTSIGTDWTKYESNSTGGLTATLKGVRQFTLSISFETISQEDDEFAPYVLDLVRTRLKRDSSLKALAAVNLSIASLKDVIEVPLTDGDHVWSKYVLDIRFNTSATEVDGSYDGSWIESVEGNMTFDPGLKQIPFTITSGIFTSAFSSAFRKE